MSITKLATVLTMFALAACSKKEAPKADTTAMAMPAPAPGAMSGNGMAMDNAKSDSIAAHAQMQLDSLVAASPEAAVKRVPEHSQAVEALLADCERMMQQMKMTPPAKWNTAVATIRADLKGMRTANAAALHAMVPAHADHLKGILGMRKDMMKM